MGFYGKRREAEARSKGVLKNRGAAWEESEVCFCLGVWGPSEEVELYSRPPSTGEQGPLIEVRVAVLLDFEEERPMCRRPEGGNVWSDLVELDAGLRLRGVMRLVAGRLMDVED